ncbi:MAG: DUF4255 domain-containing protein [Chloroflexi bacterium]|nr:MAG: DUF4255 domain-containing protein [Phototrophicales bacterium]RMF77757.1 MAG: DUF4255 domain-containing protein [Chloroflexota bacterium]
MIADLDRTLEVLLRQNLPNGLADQVTISFAPPDGDFPPQSVSLPAIDLFLYDIRENRELRQNERAVSRGNGAATLARAPVRVDCSYLITAWASDSAPNPPEDEHQLLGFAMMILLGYATLPEETLQGSLVGQTPVTRATALHPGHLQSLGEFWQALGGKPKAALNYTVTISVEPFAAYEAPVVRQRILGGMPDIEIDGS